MTTPRSLYPAGIGLPQKVAGVPLGYACPECGIELLTSDVRIIRAGGRFHGVCSATRRKAALAA